MDSDVDDHGMRDFSAEKEKSMLRQTQTSYDKTLSWCMLFKEEG